MAFGATCYFIEASEDAFGWLPEGFQERVQGGEHGLRKSPHLPDLAKNTRDWMFGSVMRFLESDEVEYTKPHGLNWNAIVTGEQLKRFLLEYYGPLPGGHEFRVDIAKALGIIRYWDKGEFTMPKYGPEFHSVSDIRKFANALNPDGLIKINLWDDL